MLDIRFNYNNRVRVNLLAMLTFLILIFLTSCSQPIDILGQIETVSPTDEVSQIQTITPTILLPTKTPAATQSLTHTQEPTPLFTPETTATSSSVITSTATTDIINTPRYSSDLIFISERKLMRWDHVTNFIYTLSEDTHEYSISDAGKAIALVRSKNMVANGVEIFELIKLDLETNQIQHVIDSTPQIYNISISPDSNWIIYTATKNGGRIYGVNSNNPDTIIEIGFCHQALDTRCDPVSWSYDSQQIIWSDQRGVWLSNIDEGNPDLITQNQITLAGPEGETSQIFVTFNNFLWSPLGRYVISSVIPLTNSIKLSVVFDTRRFEFYEVPESYQSNLLTQNVIWLQDGSLFVGTGSNQAQGGEGKVTLSIYNIVPTQEDLLQLKYSHALENQSLPKPIQDTEIPIQYSIDWIMQFSDTQLNFGIMTNYDNSLPILYSFLTDKYFIQGINQIPSYSTNVFWAPDESGALIIGSNGDKFFSLSDGGSLIPLNTTLGSDSSQFQWLAPLPRNDTN